MTKNIRVLIVDDHKMFREGLKLILSQESNIEIIGEAENGVIAYSMYRELNPDLILLDINMPELRGDELCKKIKVNNPDTKIIMLSMHDSLNIIAELKRLGADAYIVKSDDPKKIKRAISDLFSQGFYEDDRTLQAMKNASFSVEERSELSHQEIEVLKLICSEETTKEISSKLNISVKTVEAHRKNLMTKTNSKNMAGLVKYAIKNNIPLLD